MHKNYLCPGCGVQLYSENNNHIEGINASVTCQQLYFQLSYYTLSLRDDYFIHQLIVDTYAAQHFGGQVKPITLCFALVGLYLVNERNYTGRQVQQAHMTLAKKSKIWPNFSTPKEKDWLTVQDVIQSPDSEKKEMVKKWSRSVWKVWESEKEKVVSVLDKYLSD